MKLDFSISYRCFQYFLILSTLSFFEIPINRFQLLPQFKIAATFCITLGKNNKYVNSNVILSYHLSVLIIFTQNVFHMHVFVYFFCLFQ